MQKDFFLSDQEIDQKEITLKRHNTKHKNVYKYWLYGRMFLHLWSGAGAVTRAWLGQGAGAGTGQGQGQGRSRGRGRGKGRGSLKIVKRRKIIYSKRWPHHENIYH